MFLFKDDAKKPELHLACDEGLLDSMECLHTSEDSEILGHTDLLAQSTEVLRFWQFCQPVVVMGRSSRISEEVNIENCSVDGIPVLRRSSGGASIVAGPGCLMYTLLLDYRIRPAWRMLDVAHQSVMERLARATQSTLDSFGLRKSVGWQGTCDLTIDGKKFSGNALRCRRNFMIYHGTVLLQMPLEHIPRYLLQPPRQPEYRENRDHLSFVCNLLPDDFAQTSEFQHRLMEALATEWGASRSWDEFPHRAHWLRQSDELLQRKYLSPNWHRERL